MHDDNCGKCDNCGYKLTYMNSLRSDTEETKIYKCLMCGKYFRIKNIIQKET